MRRGVWRGQPLWAKLLIVASVALMAAGVVLPAYLASDAPDTEAPAGEAPAAAVDPSGLASGFAPGGGGVSGPEGAAADSAPDWSPTLFRLGFSFFVGFAIAYALRSFLKFSMFATGIVLLLLFGLQYADIIEVRWTMMEGHYDTFMGWLKVQTSTFKDFITGYLPSAASATAGMVLGFRRH